MKSNFLLISLAYLTVATLSTTLYQSTGPTYTSIGPYSFIGGGGNNTAEIQLNYKDYTLVVPLLLIVKKNNTPPTLSQIDIDNYQHNDPKASSAYDLQNANTGQRQIVSVSSLATGDKLYIFVINFLTKSRTYFFIDITERVGYSPSYCKVGNPLASTSIYCSSCNNNYTYGSFCDISPTVMPENTIYTPVIPAWNDSSPNFLTIIIPASSSLTTLYYTASYSNLIIAVQFKKSSAQVAGLMNYASRGLFLSGSANIQSSIPIDSGGSSDISVSFININPYPASLNVWFNNQKASNILIIVLAVLGGILFLGLVVVAVCVIKKMRSSPQQVNPLGSMMRGSVRAQNANDLNNQEIETYFPTVLCKNVINEQQQSSSNLAAQKQKQGERDCVICLCPIMSAQMIKVTYCRHLFHAQCLGKWFQKQRNCPYCREEYSRNATIEHYQTMLNLSHKNMLTGIDLAKQILLNKQKSNMAVEQFKE